MPSPRPAGGGAPAPRGIEAKRPSEFPGLRTDKAGQHLRRSALWTTSASLTSGACYSRARLKGDHFLLRRMVVPEHPEIETDKLHETIQEKLEEHGGSF